MRSLPYPIGAVLPYAGPITAAVDAELVDGGFIQCDGRGLPLAAPRYQPLYEVIGDAYGRDDEHFYVPDYRGRFLRATDLGAGRDPDASERTAPTTHPHPGNAGDAVGSFQADALERHVHEFRIWGTAHHIGHGNLQTVIEYYARTPIRQSEPSPPDGGQETRPKNVAVHFVIVYL